MDLLQWSIVDVNHYQVAEDFVKSFREVSNVGILSLKTSNVVERETFACMFTHYGSYCRIIRRFNAKFIADRAVVEIVDYPPLTVCRVCAVDCESEGDFDKVEEEK